MKYFLTLLVFFLCSSVKAQQINFVDFKNCKAHITFKTEMKEVIGEVSYTFDILKPIDSIFLDAKNMKFVEATLNSKKINLVNDGKRLWVKNKFQISEKNIISFKYKVKPKKALYFIDKGVRDIQIWTQGQGKYTSNWLPSIDDMNDKIEFDLSITYNKDYEVIANGALVSKKTSAHSTKWHYNMEQPMSSYLVALAIGKYYKKEEVSNKETPLVFYYYPTDSLKIEPTYRYTKRIFSFLEKEIGVVYPWQNYKQVPVKDFLYSGMENTSLTIFSDHFMVDEISFVDKNYVNVNAHELAHQWFGNLVTETSGTHHWLQEGFATYYALLAEKELFGEDYYYWKLYESAQQLLMQDTSRKNTSLLDPKSSSLTFYQRGAWVLHILKEKVGEKPFKAAIKSYLNKYKFKNVTTDYFINEVEAFSGQDLKEFVNDWIIKKEFLYDEAMISLKENSIFIQEYLMVDCEAKTSKCEYFIDSGVSDKARAKVIAQIPEKITKNVFNSSLQVRQAIAKSLKHIPKSLKKDYESLLNDKSYTTIESALYNLWMNFPEERESYLNKTKNIIGFNDKNVRFLWLILALNTKAYTNESKQHFYDELVGYTASSYSVETRQNAFSYLKSLNGFNDLALSNLVDASKSHVWRFKKFARELLAMLSENKEYKLILDGIYNK